IQAAIDDPDTLDGHTIFVKNGTYYENVVVTKQLTLIGENRNGTVIDGIDSGDTIKVVVNWVNISDVTILQGNH
ncbi:MAG: hypothetical protein ACP5FL_05745, partial [Thermoplasmatota archaeon]